MLEQHRTLGRVQEVVSACTSGRWHQPSLPACIGGLQTPMTAWHGEWEGPGTGSLPGDGMWLALAADAEGQRNEGEGQARSGNTDACPQSRSCPVRDPHPARVLPVGCTGATSSVPHWCWQRGCCRQDSPSSQTETAGSPCPVLGAGRAGPSSLPSPLGRGRALAWGDRKPRRK